MEENNSQLSILNCQFPPIDLVVPMVFPQDPEWQREYARSSGIDATRNVRFRSWGTEELLIKCIMKYMPWLRRIHILLASESQAEYIKTTQPPLGGANAASDATEVETPPKGGQGGPQIRIVFHRDFIPAEHLPCFNVNTIEMFLHRIPDLAEHFIYSNDDLFPLSPLQPEDFFRTPTPPLGGAHTAIEATEKEAPPKGGWGVLPCQRMEEKPYPDKPNIFHRFVMNGLNMVAADFGKHFTKTWLKGGHSMQPMLKRTVEHVCTLHADRISQSFTFARTDRNFNQYIFPFYQHFTGEYIDHVPTRRYLGPKADINKIVEVIRDPNAGIVCINDNEKIDDWQNRANTVRREIASKLTSDN